MKEYALSDEKGASVVVAPLVTVPIVLGMSAAYGVVGYYNPVPYLTIVLLFIFIGVTKWLLSKTMLLTKCRSTGFAGLLGVVLSMVFFYSSWTAFVAAMATDLVGDNADIPSVYLELLMSPSEVWDVAGGLLDGGWFSIFGFTPSGFVLGAFWLIEAAIIVLGIWGATAMALHEEVFCEACNRWAKIRNNDRRCEFPSTEAEIARVRDGDIDAIAGLTRRQWDPDAILEADECTPHLRINIHECDGCHKTRTLDIDLVKYEEEKGKYKEEYEDFTRVYVMEEEDFARYSSSA